MTLYIKPLNRDELIAHILEYGDNSRCTVEVQQSWFESALPDTDKQSEYPFNLGIWVRQLCDDVNKIKGNKPLRFNFNFSYASTRNMYYGVVEVDYPMTKNFKVKVSDNRYLSIGIDTVTLISNVDHIELASWKPEPDISGNGELRWIIQKEMVTRNHRDHYSFCPLIYGEAINKLRHMLKNCLDRMLETMYGELSFPRSYHDVNNIINKNTRDMHRFITDRDLQYTFTPHAFIKCYQDIYKRASAYSSINDENKEISLEAFGVEVKDVLSKAASVVSQLTNDQPNPQG